MSFCPWKRIGGAGMTVVLWHADVPLLLSLLRVIKCGTALYMRLADKASWLCKYGFNIWELFGVFFFFWEANHSGFNFLKNVQAPASVCSLSQNGFLLFLAFCTTLPRSHTDDLLRVDSVIRSRLRSPSARARTRLTSTSKDLASHPDMENLFLPTPQLPPPLPCFQWGLHANTIIPH